MICVVFMYAGNILVGKALNDLPPMTITFVRLAVAFIVLFPIGYRSVWRNKTVFLANKMPVFVLALSGITLFNTSIYGALQFTTSANVAILESAIPAVTVILSVLILKEKVMKVQWIGVVLSLFGAVWVIIEGKLLQLAALEWNIGDFIMISAILSWAVYSLFVKLHMFKFPPYAVVLVITGIGLVLLFPAVVVEWWMTGVPSIDKPGHFIGLLYLGIFPSFIALILYNRAVGLLGASKASIFLNFLPVVTMAGAALWLGERITWMHIFGTIIVISGVLLTTQGGKSIVRKEKVIPE
ncbi:DMT family transporter [Halobacillus sp. A1]|uniref:DMT family transporter n=1 Tax=Halobacillus sp. A1 TaxID=2880262 RepID=UPI002113BD8A|nr:DMT family transporter [Halobacillus sp. A1]MCP3032205.1 DMT family transporter [Halobacillus sp. A1]